MSPTKYSAVSLAVLLSICAISPASEPGAISWEINADVAGVGEARFKRESSIGDVSSVGYTFDAVASVQTRPGFLVRFGFDLQRFDFDLPSGAPLPSNLESVALVLGGDFQLGEGWLLRAEVRPGFYGGSGDLSTDTFNAPLIVGGSYFFSPDLQLILGLSVDLNRKYPVLPGAGVRWRFAREWVLSAILPSPRLEYTVNQAVTVYAGGDFLGDSYRVDGGRRDLQNAVLAYTQIRVGGGLTWKIDPHFTMEFEAGCVTAQDFDYHRAEIGVRSQERPAYARIGLQARF